MKKILAGAILAAAMLLTGPAVADEHEANFEGLVEVEGSSADVAMISPDADFSVFRRVAIMEPQVSFVRNWQRDQNRTRRGNSRVSNADMERIKDDVATMFRDIFIETLQENNGFEVVDEAADDVLVILPAVIDLDITAADTMSAGRSRTYVTSAGAATVYIQMYDSVSGALIGRAADRSVARRNNSRLSWNSGVMNRQEGRRMFTQWATQMRTFLDQHYTIGETE